MHQRNGCTNIQCFHITTTQMSKLFGPQIVTPLSSQKHVNPLRRLLRTRSLDSSLMFLFTQIRTLKSSCSQVCVCVCVCVSPPETKVSSSVIRVSTAGGQPPNCYWLPNEEGGNLDWKRTSSTVFLVYKRYIHCLQCFFCQVFQLSMFNSARTSDISHQTQTCQKPCHLKPGF